MSYQANPRRQPGRDPSKGAAASTPPRIASEPDDKASYIQALFVAFWKPIFIVLGFVHMIVGVGIVKLTWADPVQYLYGLAVLIAVPVAYVEIEYFSRWMKWESGPIWDWRERSMILVGVGYGLALALVISLAISEANGRATTQVAQEQMSQEREQQRQILNDPNVRRGMEALQARQEKMRSK